MVRINRVYTRTGDEGLTRLAGGQRLSKAHPRIEAYGTVDELNAFLGFAREVLLKARSSQGQNLAERLLRIQNELFDLGTELAVLPEDRRPDTPTLPPDSVDLLERELDEMNESLPPLTSFILPGGGEISIRLHLARTVCRRAERTIVRLMEEKIELPPHLLRYLNRLSDWLFVSARYISWHEGEKEHLWQPGGGRS
jgi:cob(I)alamin adenosyltransferase